MLSRHRTSEIAIVAWGALTFAALLASFTAFHGLTFRPIKREKQQQVLAAWRART